MGETRRKRSLSEKRQICRVFHPKLSFDFRSAMALPTVVTKWFGS
jgi:hypothetical protein